MKTKEHIGILCASIIAITMNSAWAETKADPVVGGSIIAVNVDVVATTGYRATELLDSTIYNDKGESIGVLEDFIVGSDASVSIAVIAVGGFLGVGARNIAVPASLLKGNEAGQTILPDASKESLLSLPEFLYAK